MKLTWLTLPVLLTAGIACAHGWRLPAELDSITPGANIEAIGDFSKGGAAVTALLAAGLGTLSRTAPANLLRSMWGD